MPGAVAVGLFSTLEVISVVITLFLGISIVVVVDIAGVPVVLSAFKIAQRGKKKRRKNTVVLSFLVWKCVANITFC